LYEETINVDVNKGRSKSVLRNLPAIFIETNIASVNAFRLIV